MTRGTVECARCHQSVPIEEAWKCWHTMPEIWELWGCGDIYLCIECHHSFVEWLRSYKEVTP